MVMSNEELLRIRAKLPLPSECESDKLEFHWVIQTNDEGDIQIQKHVFYKEYINSICIGWKLTNER